MNSFMICTKITLLIKSRINRWAVRVVRMRGDGNPYRIFVGKPKGKRPLERRRR